MRNALSVSTPLAIALALLSTLLHALSWPLGGDAAGFWWLSFVSMAPLTIAVIGQATWKRAFLLAFLTQWPACLFCQWWLIQVTPPGMIGLALYCTFYLAVYAVVIRRVARSKRFGHWPMALVMPIVWTGCEYLRTTIVLGGYPWYQLGIPLVGGATFPDVFGQSASLLGSHVLSTLAASVSGVLVDWWRVRRDGYSRARAIWATAAILVLQLMNVIYGANVGRGTLSAGPVVLAVQTDLSISNKNSWEWEDQLKDVGSFLTMSVQGVLRARDAGTPPNVVVWPETMVPGFGLEPATIATLTRGNFRPGSVFSDALDELRSRLGVPFLVGSSSYLGLRADADENRWKWDQHFNSAYFLDGPAPFLRYDKMKLTPFGEEMPLISNWDWLEEKMLAFGAPGMSFDLDSGDQLVRFPVRFGQGRTAMVATPICFEDTVGPLCRRLCYERGRKVVDVMINLSNDGWFGWSDVGRAQHALHARLRSIELAIPMVRVTNGGFSMLIDDRGRIVEWIAGPEHRPAPGQSRIADTLLTVPQVTDRVTLYGRIGDVWPWIAFVATGLMAVFARPRSLDASDPNCCAP